MTVTTNLPSASLHLCEGNSNKEYHDAIESRGEDYIVTFAYGRRGSTLTTGSKTTHPVSLAEASKVFDKLISSKLAKGYQQSGETTKPYQQTGEAGCDTGIRCQLLNAIEKPELMRLIMGTTHCLQPKHDGRRLMIRKQGDEIIGINRRGLIVAVPDAIRQAFEHILFDVLIDGEAVGDTLHAFDLLEVKGNDLRDRRYIDRHAGLIMVIPSGNDALRWVSTAIDPNDKLETFEELNQSGGEGVVLKAVDAPYSPGRPNSGGSQLKFKFVESASFIVTGHNAKHSVTLALHGSDGETLVPAGNVTIPPNREIPEIGAVCEVRYLYAYRESGSLYQPVYAGRRDDIPPSECVEEQLKYRSEPPPPVA